MKIFNFEYNELHFLYIKWYIIISIICIIVFLIGNYVYKYLLKKGVISSKQINNNNLDVLDNNNLDKLDNNNNNNNNLDVLDNNNLDKLDNNNNNNLDKLDNNKKKPFIKNTDIFYIYWTGGYDSSYRLCEMLIVEKKIVQPLYVSYSLDNDCPESEEKCKKMWVRRNRKQEKEAMNNIKRELFKQYPWCKKLLLPTIYIEEDIDDKLFNDYYDLKFYKDNLWPKKRSKHQYLFLSKYAYYHKIFIDTGILGIHKKTYFQVFLDNNLIKIIEKYNSPISKKKLISYNYGFKDNLIQEINVNGNIIKSKHYMYYLRMSCYGKTKKDLLLKAKKYGFQNILLLTWSCWFPDKKTGKQCGKCPMCRERIIQHPSNN